MSSASMFYRPQESAQQTNAQQKHPPGIPSDSNQGDDLTHTLEELARFLGDTQPSLRGVASMAYRQGDFRREGTMNEAFSILSHIERDLFANDKVLQSFSEKLQPAAQKVQVDNSELETPYSAPAPAV